MPIRGKAPVVKLVRKSAPLDLESQVQRLLVGQKITAVSLKGDFLTLSLESGETLQFHHPGGFKEHKDG